MNLTKQRIAVVFATVLIAAALVAVAIGTKVGALDKQTPVVQIALAQNATSRSDVMAQGVIVPESSANVSVLPRFEAQVTEVPVQVGDHVTKGQTLAVLDPIYQQDQASQAAVAVQSAQARYDLVRHPYRPEEIERQQAKVDAGTQAVSEARSQLTLLLHGRRPQDLAAAKAEVEAAKSTLAQAETDQQYNQKLYDKELLPKADLEKSQTVVDVDRNALEVAKAHRDIVQIGPRAEEIETAQAALKLAEANRDADLKTYRVMQLGSRPEEIEVAAAELAKARLLSHEQNVVLARQVVQAPISGVVVERNVNPGEVAAPDATRSDVNMPLSEVRESLFVIADETNVEFRANVDERFYRSVHVGQAATVSFESDPGREFHGKIVRMKPLINADNGRSGHGDSVDVPLTFDVWVSLSNPDGKIVLGETGIVTMSQNASGVVIPQSALTPFSSGNGVVYVENNGTVGIHNVKFANIVNGQVRILSGVKTGDHVVVSSPFKLADGMIVKTDNSHSSGTSPM